MLRKIVAGLIAVIMAVPAGTAVLAAKGSTDFDVAEGKSAISACYGNGEYAGGTVANVTSDSGIFISDGGWDSEHMEIITIDLGAKYSINQIDVASYYADQSKGEFYNYGNDVVFDCYVMNTAPANQHDAPASAVKLNVIGDKFQPASNGGYNSYFEPEKVAPYRYVQLRLLKGTGQTTAFRIPRIRVWAPDTFDMAPVSVGKPVYSKFNGTSFGKELYMINDGDASTVYLAYGATDENADVIIDLENEYPITMVTQTLGPNGKGEIVGVYASNDPSFVSCAIFNYDEEDTAWYIDPSEAELYGEDFKYIMIDYSVEPYSTADGADHTNVVWDQAEITVYSTKSAAQKAVSQKTNIARGKAVTSKIYGHNDGLVALTDGDTTGNEFINYAKAETQGEYYDIDLGNSYTITNIKTYHNSYHAASVGEVWVSNDPSFINHEVFTTMQYHTDHNNDPVKYNSTPSGLAEDLEGYRYVRIFEPSDGYGDNPWRIREIEIYVPTSETVCENRAFKRSVTLYNDDGTERGADYNYWGMVKESFVDGNESTEGGLSNNCVLVELDYPQKIEWIDVIMRGAPGEHNKKGYNVYLSNEKSNNTDNALQIGQTASYAAYSAGETIRYTPNTDTRYKYVIVTANSNGECIAKEIKVFSSSEPRNTEITNTISQSEGEYTLTCAFEGDYQVDKYVKMIIARYDGTELKEISISDVKTVSSQSGELTFNFTPTGEVSENDAYYGFVWECDTEGKTTMVPFGNVAGK